MMFDLYPDILTVIPPGDATTDPSARAGVFPPGKRTGGQRLCGRFCFGSLGMQTVDMKIVRGAVPTGGCVEKTRDET